MAFNAGEIQATLTLDRSPFQRGLDEAKAEADRFRNEKFEAKLDADSSAAKREIDEARVSAEKFAATDAKARLGVDKAGFDAEIDRAREQVDQLASKSASIRVSADTRPARDAITEVRRDVERLSASSAAIRVSANTEAAKSAIAQLNAQANTALTPKELKVNAQIQSALVEIDRVTARLAELNAKKTDPKVDLDIKAAQAAESKLTAQLEALQAKKANPTVDLDISKAENELEQVSRQLDELNFKKTDPQVDLDIASAGIKYDQLVAKLQQLEQMTPTPKVQADIQAAMVAFAQVQNRLNVLNAKRSDPKVDLDIAAAELKVEQINNKLDALEAEKANPKIDLDIAAAEARLAQVRGKLDELGSKRTDPKIDLDIGAAEAKLALLQAQLAGLQEPAEAAASSMSTFQRYALLAAAATPLIAAGIIALPGIVATAVTPIAAVAVGLDGIKAAAGGLNSEFLSMKSAVSSVFAGSLQPSISNLASLMPTLTTGLMGTASALGTVASEVTGVVSSAAGMQQVDSIFQSVNQIVASLAPSIGLLTQNFMGLAQIGLAGLRPLGEMLTDVGTRWQELIADLQQTGVGQAAVSALVQVLGGLLDIIPPLVQAGAQVMAVLGPPLAGALEATASILSFLSGPLGSVTTAVIASVAAWKALQLVMTGLGAAGTKIGSVFANIATSVTGANRGLATTATATGRAATSAEQAAASSGRMGSALSRIGNTLPVIGAAFIAYQAIVSASTVSTDQATDAWMQGGAAADAMRTRVAGQTLGLGQYIGSVGSAIDKVVNWTHSTIFQIATLDSVDQAIQKQRDSMTDLQRAQQDATIAGNNYQLIAAKFGPTSMEAAVFADQYAQAMDRVNQAQAAAATSMLSANMQNAASHFGPAAAAADTLASSVKGLGDAYAKLADPMASATEKAAAFTDVFKNASDAPTQLALSTQKVNDAMRALPEAITPANARLVGLNGVIDTTSEAGSKLQTAIFSATEAIQGTFGASVAAAQGQANMGAAVGAAAGKFEQQKKALVDTMVQQGVSRASAQALVDTYLKVPPGIATQFTTPGAVQATAEALGLKDQILSVPNDKTVVVKSLTEAAQQQLRDLGLTVTQLPDGSFSITADPSPANTTIDGVKQQVVGTELAMKLGINPTGVIGALPGLRASVSNSPAEMPILPDNQAMPGGILENKNLAQSNPAQQPITPGTNGVPPALAGNQGLAGGALAGQPIAPSSNTMPGAILGNQGLAAGTPAQQPLTGNPAPFHGVLQAQVGVAASTTGTMNLAANPASAIGQVAFVQRLGSEPATKPVFANVGSAVGSVAGLTAQAVAGATKPVGANTGAGLSAVAGLQGAASAGATKPVNANTGAAMGAVSTLQGSAQAGATKPVNANTGAAMGAINGLIAAASRTVTMVVNVVHNLLNGSGAIYPNAAGQVYLNAAGNVYGPPVVDLMDAGGMPSSYQGHALTPMARSARMVAPNSWRIVGDRRTGPEAYIPIDGSARSTALLSTAADMMGFSVIPKGTALASQGGDGGTLGGTPVAAGAGQSPVGRFLAGLATGLEQLSAAVRANAVTAASQVSSVAAVGSSMSSAVSANTTVIAGHGGVVASNSAVVGINSAAVAAGSARFAASIAQSVTALAGNNGAAAALGGTMNSAAGIIASAAQLTQRAAASAQASAAQANASAARAVAARSAPPPDDDSFASNSYYDPNRGKPGYKQAEDGSWVKASFYRATGDIVSMAAGTPATVSPGQLRAIVGDARDDEAYIPLNQSARSQALLATAAARMGWSLTSAAVRADLGDSGAPGVSVETMRGAARAATDSPDFGPLIEEVRRMRDELRVLAAARATTINNSFYTDASAEQADTTVRALRKQSALGLFGDG